MRKEPMRENLRYSDEYGWLPLTKRSTVIGCYWPQFIPNIDELIRTSMTTARNRPFCTMSPPGAIERPGPGPLKKLWLTGQRGWGRWCLLVSRVRGHSRGDSWGLGKVMWTQDLLTLQVIPRVKHVNYNLQFIPISGTPFFSQALWIPSCINHQSFETALEEAMMSQWSEHVLQLQSS